MANPNDVLTNRGEIGSIIFPNNLGSPQVRRYVTFTAVSGSKDSATASTLEGEIASVSLPLPSNLTDATAYEFIDDALFETGRSVGAAYKVMSNLTMENVKNWYKNDYMNDPKGEWGKLFTKLGPWKRAAERNLRNHVFSLLSGAQAESIERTVVGAVNPHLRNNFAGIGFKTHSFQFNLVAKDLAETQSIIDIKHFFNYFSAPTWGTQYIKPPNYFDVVFGPGEAISDSLYKPGRCYITGVGLNYAGGGETAFFNLLQSNYLDAPVNVVMELQLKEVDVVHKEEYLKRYPQAGWLKS